MQENSNLRIFEWLDFCHDGTSDKGYRFSVSFKIVTKQVGLQLSSLHLTFPSNIHVAECKATLSKILLETSITE